MRKYFFWALLILIVFVRYITTQPNFIDGQRLRISSQVTTEPSSSFEKQRLSLAGLKILLPIFPEIHYGDYIVVEGVVKNGELSDAKLKDLKVSNNILIGIRRKLISFYSRSLPNTDSSLVAGIVIGAKSALSSEFYSKLKNTGTSHVVVASGMNVTMVSGFVLAILLRFFKKHKAIVITLGSILIYCGIVGFEAPIVRAAIMASLAFTTQLVGRLANTLKILFVTGFTMLIIQPSWISDVGFVLSFATTLSMILFERKIDRLIHFIPVAIRESLSTSLSAQILAGPIILIVFGRFNLLSPIINALVLWTVAPIMVFGGFGGIVGLVCEPLGRFILLLIYPLTQWFIWVINMLG